MQLMEPPKGLPWALLLLAGSSLAMNVVLVGALLASGDGGGERVTRTVSDAETPVLAAAAIGVEPAAEPGVVAVDAEAPAAPTKGAKNGEGRRHVVRANINHSLARTFQDNGVAEHADVVSAIYARLFVWDLDLRKDLQRGDSLSVVYDWDGALAEIPVATYTSGKLGRTLVAYRYTASGDEWPSWWDANGVEVPRRLVNGPLQGDYEQITSLLKDRPTHRGMDFKVAEGTDVVSPKGGTVVRTDWNLKFNGNCVEVQYDDGVLARFLHLSDTKVKAGQRLRPNQVVGLSGNTGRSTAPHLHYELEKNGQVVDPVTYHGVQQRKLGAADLEAFQATARRYDRLLQQES